MVLSKISPNKYNLKLSLDKLNNFPQYISVYMGQIAFHCCPFSMDKHKTEDSLSRNSSPAAIEELEVTPKPSIKVKKVKKHLQLQTLQKQQSAYFNKNQILKLQQNSLKVNLIPIMGPKGKGNQIIERQKGQDHSTYYSKVKGKIKPQLYKTSTMDEEDSAHDASQFGRSSFFFDEPSQQMNSQFDNEDRNIQKNSKDNEKNNRSLSGNENQIDLSKFFRTEKYKINHDEKNNKQKIKQIQKQLKDEDIDIKTQISLNFDLAKHYLAIAELLKSKNLLEICLSLFSQNITIEDIPLQSSVYFLIGCISFMQKDITNAIEGFVKALRLIIMPENQNIKIVEIYYWLGQCYIKEDKITLARDYLLKSLKKYQQYSLEDPAMLQTLFLLLGNIYHKEEQYAEADKYYMKALKIRDESQNSQKYFQLLLRTAENMFSMDNYRQAVVQFNKNFKQMRKLNYSTSPIFQQAHKSFANILKKIVEIKISQNELHTIIKLTESVFPQEPQLQELRKRLTKMRSILYK